MKKKIIFVLSFLTMVLCLSGCGYITIAPAQLREMTAIVQNIKDNTSYQLPDGYHYELVDNTKNDQIVIRSTGGGREVRLICDISEEEVQVLNIEVDNYGDIGYLLIGIILGIGFIMCYLILSLSAYN